MPGTCVNQLIIVLVKDGSLGSGENAPNPAEEESKPVLLPVTTGSMEYRRRYGDKSINIRP